MTDAAVSLVDTPEEVVKFVEWIENRSEPLIAIDTETTGVGFYDTIRTVQFGDTKAAWVVPYERDGYGGAVHHAMKAVHAKRLKVVMHNFKFDQHMLDKDGLMVDDSLVYDTRIMAHIIDPTRPTGLKPLADRYVRNSASHGQKKLDEAMRANKWTWATVPWRLPEYWFYGGLDTIITARLYHALEEMVFPAFRKIYDLEYASQTVLRRVEAKGVRVDLDYVDRVLLELLERADKIQARASQEFGVKNLTSSDQVARWMLNQGWEPKAFTDGGKPSMTKDVLNGLSSDPRFPVASMAAEFRHLMKMASTQYLGGYRELTDKNGFIHPSINPIGARTGRMSVKAPALQTLHRDALVRDAFIPRDGNKMIFADYDQMEVRLTAAIAGDRGYMDIIRTSKDVHTTTAAQVYGIPESEVTKDMRQRTKNVVYAKLYGAGIDTFSETAGITTDEGQRFMDAFDCQFPAVKGLIDHISGVRINDRRVSPGIAEKRYYEEGLAYVMSPYGRRHILNEREVEPYTDSKGVRWLSGPLYRLVNYLVQGTGADVLKQAIVDADRAGIADHLVLLVHDETGWDVPERDVPELTREIVKAMTVEQFQGTPVDLTVQALVVDRWGDKYREVKKESESFKDKDGNLVPKADQ